MSEPTSSKTAPLYDGTQYTGERDFIGRVKLDKSHTPYVQGLLDALALDLRQTMFIIMAATTQDEEMKYIRALYNEVCHRLGQTMKILDNYYDSNLTRPQVKVRRALDEFFKTLPEYKGIFDIVNPNHATCTRFVGRTIKMVELLALMSDKAGQKDYKKILSHALREFYDS